MSQPIERELFRKLFAAQSVAFVGASDTPGKWGYTILMHILQGGYDGRLYLINPGRPSVLGRPCHASLAEVPEVPDLAVLVIPAAHLLRAAQDCVEKGIKAAVVITSGFAEIGEEGKLLQARLTELARAGGMRFVGPNSMGLFSATPSRLVSIMASVIPRPGPAAVVSQSGNLGVSLMTRLERRGIGISRCVSVGNEADLALADYLDLLADDDRTRVIAVYAEGTRDGRRLQAALGRTTPKKPVVLIKGGHSAEGQRAASSHTAALSGSYELFAAALREAGTQVAETMDEVVTLSGAFCSQPLPKGRRTAIVTFGGGWGVLATDACARLGIELPPLPKDVIEGLNAYLPEYWSHANPVDLVATNKPENLAAILEILLASPAFDAVIFLGVGYIMHVGLQYTKPMPDPQPTPAPALVGEYLIECEWALADAIAELPARHNKPLLCVADLAVREDELERNAIRKLEARGLFVYNSPEDAALALAALNRRAEFLKAAAEPVAEEAATLPEARAYARAKELVAEAQKRPHGQMSEHESKRLLAALGIAAPPEREAATEEEAARAAFVIGYPVALKLSSPEILHKTEAQGVRLNLRDEAALRAAARELLPRGDVLVQAMAKPTRVELLVGLSQDPSFGPVITFGKGGTETEVWRDAASLPAPLTRAQAESLIDRTRVATLIGPFRKQPALDRQALVDLLVRVSHLPTHFPEVAELDINPLFLYEDGAVAVDAAIVLKRDRS